MKYIPKGFQNCKKYWITTWNSKVLSTKCLSNSTLNIERTLNIFISWQSNSNTNSIHHWRLFHSNWRKDYSIKTYFLLTPVSPYLVTWFLTSCTLLNNAEVWTIHHLVRWNVCIHSHTCTYIAIHYVQLYCVWYQLRVNAVGNACLAIWHIMQWDNQSYNLCIAFHEIAM